MTDEALEWLYETWPEALAGLDASTDGYMLRFHLADGWILHVVVPADVAARKDAEWVREQLRREHQRARESDDAYAFKLTGWPQLVVRDD